MKISADLPMRKVLLIGSEGQVGQELQTNLSAIGEVTSVNRQILDLTQSVQIRQLIAAAKPDIIVNAAAYTAVDKAETEPEIAFAVNAIAPQMIAEEAQKLGTFLLHISTDYVFDGTQNIPYTEEDVTNPLSVYGKSKLTGEIGIQKSCDRYLILRTAWVYGVFGKSNFVKTMLRLGQEREQLRVVSDQVGSPTWSKDIADVIAQLILTDGRGIYHFTNSGIASWYDFAVAIFEEAKSIGFPVKIQSVVPITTAEYPTPAKRPAYSVLSGKKVTATVGNYPPYWRNSLRQMLDNLYKD